MGEHPFGIERYMDYMYENVKPYGHQPTSTPAPTSSVSVACKCCGSSVSGFSEAEVKHATWIACRECVDLKEYSAGNCDARFGSPKWVLENRGFCVAISPCDLQALVRADRYVPGVLRCGGKGCGRSFYRPDYEGVDKDDRPNYFASCWNCTDQGSDAGSASDLQTRGFTTYNSEFRGHWKLKPERRPDQPSDRQPVDVSKLCGGVPTAERLWQASTAYKVGEYVRPIVEAPKLPLPGFSLTTAPQFPRPTLEVTSISPSIPPATLPSKAAGEDLLNFYYDDGVGRGQFLFNRGKWELVPNEVTASFASNGTHGLSVESLARSLFDTDTRIQELLHRYSEGREDRKAQVLERIWSKELQIRQDCEKRAAVMCSLLEQRR